MKKFIAYTFILVAFTSCQEVIEIDLDSSEPRLVVESVITDNSEPWEARLTMMAPYFDNTNPVVTTAQVYISDDLGVTDTLFHVGNGIYRTNGNEQCVAGHTYTMLILLNGKSYQAQSTVPALKVNLDTVLTIFNEESAFIEEGYNIIFAAQDNPGYTDYYRFKVWKNDTLQTDPFKYFVTDDLGVDGNYVLAQVPYNFQIGDTARAEIQNMDKAYYDFLFAISSQTSATGGPFDPPPSNLPSNFDNGAIGFFAAITSSRKEIVIQP